MPIVSAGHPDDGDTEFASALAWIHLGGVGIDTAFVYQNQDQVGEAVRQSGKNRTELFITTKVVCPEPFTSEQKVVAAVKEDLKELKMEYVDLMLIHFPCAVTGDSKNAWKGLQEVHALGLARAIGVSNFGISDMTAVLSLGGVKPAINQCSMSLDSHDDATIQFAQSNNITYQAYSPLRHVNFSDPRIASVAKSHNVSSAQVALRWIYQQDVLIATSPGANEEYIKEDLALDSFTLTSAEMKSLSSIQRLTATT
ncbi:hypothetical protein CYMTET_37794 [Cymbomonas tetramitiformis]|uniref:NADP-dependent oxidoreductase domain-containing protein n=1 Tax=Cymbomonas tetramitiformis TaxID=36881 RepID=A0AAE0CDD1_9CHLO|nr:hypothetical protein CYMTET_37794 [Cymbomonas tetramitiformis]|eukprot:gene21831-26273_t